MGRNDPSRGTHTSNYGLCPALLFALKKCFETPDSFHNAPNYRMPDSSDPTVLCSPLYRAMVRNLCEEEIKEVKGLQYNVE